MSDFDSLLNSFRKKTPTYEDVKNTSTEEMIKSFKEPNPISVTPEEKFQSETGMNSKDTYWDELAAFTNNFANASTLGVFGVLQPDADKELYKASEELSPVASTVGMVAGSVGAGLSSGAKIIPILENTLAKKMSSKLAATAVSRGTFSAGFTGASNAVDVAKGDKELNDVMKEAIISGISGGISVAPEVIKSFGKLDYIIQPLSQALVGVASDAVVRASLNEFADDGEKKQHLTLEEMTSQYGLQVAMDAGFALIDVKTGAFKSSNAQYRKELASLFGITKKLNPNANVTVSDVEISKNIATQEELEAVEKAILKNAGVSDDDMPKVIADIRDRVSRADYTSNTYGKNNGLNKLIADNIVNNKQDVDETKVGDVTVKQEPETVKVDVTPTKTEDVVVSTPKIETETPKVETQNIESEAPKIEATKSDPVVTDKKGAVTDAKYIYKTAKTLEEKQFAAEELKKRGYTLFNGEWYSKEQLKKPLFEDSKTIIEDAEFKDIKPKKEVVKSPVYKNFSDNFIKMVKAAKTPYAADKIIAKYIDKMPNDVIIKANEIANKLRTPKVDNIKPIETKKDVTEVNKPKEVGVDTNNINKVIDIFNKAIEGKDAKKISNAKKILEGKGYVLSNNKWLPKADAPKVETIKGSSYSEPLVMKTQEIETAPKPKKEVKAKPKDEVEAVDYTKMSDDELNTKLEKAKKDVDPKSISNISKEIKARASNIKSRENKETSVESLYQESFKNKRPIDKKISVYQAIADDITSLIGLDPINISIKKLGKKYRGGIQFTRNSNGKLLNAEIIINNTLKDNIVSLSTLTHELGHYVSLKAFDSSPYKQEILKQWEIVKKDRVVGANLYDYILKHHGKKRALQEKNLTSKKIIEADLKNNGLLDFEEWIADNISAWMTNKAEPKSIIEKAWKSIAKRVKEFFLKVQDETRVNSPIWKMMDDMITGNIKTKDIEIEYTGDKEINSVKEPDENTKGIIDDIRSIISNSESPKTATINSMLQYHIDRLTKRGVKVDEDKLFNDHLGVILMASDSKSLTPKMQAYKAAFEKFDFNDSDATEVSKMLDGIDTPLNKDKHTASFIMSKYITDYDNMVVDMPKTNQALNEYINMTANGVHEALEDANKEDMIERGNDIGVIEEQHNIVKSSKEKDFEQYAEYSKTLEQDKVEAEAVIKKLSRDEALDAYTQSLKEVEEIKGKGKHKVRAWIEQFNINYDSAFGFRLYAGDIIKYFSGSKDAKTIETIKKIKEVKDYTVREADFDQILVESYQKELDGLVFSKIPKGKLNEFNIYSICKSLLNDSTMQGRKVLISKGNEIDAEFAKKFIETTELKDTFDDMIQSFYDVRMKWIMPKIESGGMFAQSYVDFMKSNTNYITYKHIIGEDYDVDKTFSIDHVSNAYKVIKKREVSKETESLLENVFVSTIKHDVAIIQAMSNNVRKADVIGCLLSIKKLKQQFDGIKIGRTGVKDIEKMKMINQNEYDKKIAAGDYIEPHFGNAPAGKVKVELYVNGVKEAYAIDELLVPVFNDIKDTGLMNTVAANVITRFARTMYITANTAFLIRNTFIDMYGTATRISPKVLAYYPKAFIQAFKSAGKNNTVLGNILPDFIIKSLPKEVRDKIEFQSIDGMYKFLSEEKVLMGGNNTKGLFGNTIDANILKKDGNIVDRGFGKIMNVMQSVNTVVERTSKFAASEYLKNTGLYTNKEIAGITREFAGSPNFMIRGSKSRTINNIFMFANPTLRGWAQFGKGATRTKQAMMLTLGTIGFKIFMDLLARSVDEGPEDKEIARGGITIPLAQSFDDNGQYLRSYYAKLPIDRSANDIGALISLSIMQASRAMNGESYDTGKVLEYGFSMVPSLQPVIQLFGDAVEFGTTGNITNSLGYKVLNNDEMKAGASYKVPKIATHTLKTMGVQNLITDSGIELITGEKKSRIKEEKMRSAEREIRSNVVTDNIPGGTAMLSAITGLNGIPFVTPISKAFIKKSNYGLAEQYAMAGADIDRITAEEKIKVTKSIERYLDNDFTNEDVINILTYKGDAAKIMMGYSPQAPLVRALNGTKDPKKQALILNEYFKVVD